MTERPNARDYANRAERNAAWWREEAANMIDRSTEQFQADTLAVVWELRAGRHDYSAKAEVL